jgi:hypothetical protein
LGNLHFRLMNTKFVFPCSHVQLFCTTFVIAKVDSIPNNHALIRPFVTKPILLLPHQKRKLKSSARIIINNKKCPLTKMNTR